LLNLGHSFLHSTSLENSEDEEEEEGEEEESEEEESEEEESEDEKDPLNKSKKNVEVINDSKVELTKDFESNYSNKMQVQFDNEILLEFDKEHTESIKQISDKIIQVLLNRKKQISDVCNNKQKYNTKINQEFKDKSYKFDEYIKEKSNLYVHHGSKHGFEEKSGKQNGNNALQLFSELYSTNLQVQTDKNINNTLIKQSQNINKGIQRKSYNEILLGINEQKIQENGDIEKQLDIKTSKNINLDTEMQVDIKSQEKLYEQVQEKKQMSTIDVEIEHDQYNIQFNSTCTQELDGIMREETRDNKKILETFVEIKLDIEVQKNSESQQELDVTIQDDFDNDKKNVSDEDIEVELIIEILDNLDVQQKIDEIHEIVQNKFNSEKQQNPEKDKEIELDIDVQQVFDKKLLKEFDNDKKLILEREIQNKCNINNMQQIKKIKKKNFKERRETRRERG